MRRQILSRAILWVLLVILVVNRASALNEPTHAIINEQAATQSGLNQSLKGQLGFPEGIGERFRKRTVLDWIGQGGKLEDALLSDALVRFLRHFHDPLYQADSSGRGPWNQAGLDFGVKHESSIRWMQRTDQDWSWKEARRRYADALTGSDQDARDSAFAALFRTLGQIMHLVVDASVPLHVRNDPHPGGPLYGNYEHWVEEQHGLPGSPEEQNFINTFLSNPFAFDTSILQQPTNDSLAPVPVARLIDTDTYQGTDPNVTLGTAIGIAEFANANFFSEDTGDGQYPFPKVSALLPTQRQAPQTPRIRAYYKKAPGDGVEVDPVLSECVLDEMAVAEGLAVSRIGTCTDENVWSQVASNMLPRAVSYAGTVLDYFFRGRLDLAIDAAQLELRVTNRSSEAIGPGTLSIYCDDPNGNRVKLDEMTVTQEVQADAEFPRIPFSFPAGTLRCVMVFEGKLGEEADAVIGKVFQLGIRPVARTGDAVPGGGTFGTFFFGRPAVNEAGIIVFNGVFADNQTEGIFIESQEVLQPPVVRAGDAAPGGGTFGFFGSLGLDDQGTIAFYGGFDEASSCNDLLSFCGGAFLAPAGGQPVALARAGDPVPGGCGIAGVTILDPDFESVSLNNQGEVSFVADFVNPGFLNSEGFQCLGGLLVATAQTPPQPVVQEGDPVPGGGRFQKFFGTSTDINEIGDIAFDSDSQGIFVAGAAPLRSVVRSGDPAPGGGTFTNVRDPSLNDAGAVAFRGMLGATTGGIFLRSPTGQLTAVARTDDPAPGGGQFRSFGHPAMNNLGVIAFTARLDDLSEGLFHFASGTVTALARTGDFPLGGGTFDRFSGLSSTEGPAINDAGQVAFIAILADGRRGVFVAEPTTLPTQIP